MGMKGSVKPHASKWQKKEEKKKKKESKLESLEVIFLLLWGSFGRIDFK